MFFLKQQDIARIDVVNYITHGISKIAGEGETSDPGTEQQEEGASENRTNPLESFATNLNSEAEAGRIDPLIGRLEEVTRVVQILSRRRKTTRCSLVSLE